MGSQFIVGVRLNVEEVNAGWAQSAGCAHERPARLVSAGVKLLKEGCRRYDGQ